MTGSGSDPVIADLRWNRKASEYRIIRWSLSSGGAWRRPVGGS
jgi:hypothetical protein